MDDITIRINQVLKDLAGTVTDPASLRKAVQIVNKMANDLGQTVANAPAPLPDDLRDALYDLQGGPVGLANREDITDKEIAELLHWITDRFIYSGAYDEDGFSVGDAQLSLSVLAHRGLLSDSMVTKVLEEIDEDDRFAKNPKPARALFVEALATFPLPEDILLSLIAPKDTAWVNDIATAKLVANPNITESLLERLEATMASSDISEYVKVFFWTEVLTVSPLGKLPKWHQKARALPSDLKSALAINILSRPALPTGFSSDELFTFALERSPHRTEPWFHDVPAVHVQSLSKPVLARLIDSPNREMRLRVIQILGLNKKPQKPSR